MAETKNLYQKLLAITEEIGKIEKTGNNSSQGYAFIEQSQVVAEVRVQLKKHGVMIIPETVSRTMDRYTTMKPGYNGQPPKEQATIHANVVSRYTLVNADDPTERMVCEWDAGEALDTSDKATNKAVTASHKYFLMKLFNISDKEDPDAETPEAPATTATATSPAPAAAGTYAAPKRYPAKKVETEAEPEPAAPPKTPNAMDQLKRLMVDKGLGGEEATAFVQKHLGKPKPVTDADAWTLISALGGKS